MMFTIVRLFALTTASCALVSASTLALKATSKSGNEDVVGKLSASRHTTISIVHINAMASTWKTTKSANMAVLKRILVYGATMDACV